jgi:hypothetical protein
LLTATGLTLGGSGLHKNNTQNNTINLGRVRAVLRLYESYLGICLTTEEKAWKNLSSPEKTHNIVHIIFSLFKKREFIVEYFISPICVHTDHTYPPHILLFASIKWTYNGLIKGTAYYFGIICFRRVSEIESLLSYV